MFLCKHSEGQQPQEREGFSLSLQQLCQAFELCLHFVFPAYSGVRLHLLRRPSSFPSNLTYPKQLLFLINPVKGGV